MSDELRRKIVSVLETGCELSVGKISYAIDAKSWHLKDGSFDHVKAEVRQELWAMEMEGIVESDSRQIPFRPKQYRLRPIIQMVTK